MDEQNTATESTISTEGMATQGAESATASQEQTEVEQNSGAEQGTGTESTENEQEATEGTGDGTAAAEEPAAPFLTVRYNHAPRDLTREEATQHAQRGIKYEGVINNLEYLAAQSDTSPAKFVENLIASAENQYIAGIKAQLGENVDEQTIADMLTVYRNKQQDKYNKVKETAEAEKQNAIHTTEQRLADEYSALKSIVPNIPDFAELPKSVLQKAADNGDLVKEYLIYKEKEKQVADAAKADALKQEAATTGSGAAGQTSVDGLESAILSGIWS